MTLSAGLPPHAAPDPLLALRGYSALAPWGLRDLAGLAGALLDTANVVPVNAAARARPSERTIRFYVARGLVSPPEGRGTAATYVYRHLLQVLAIKLRQMDGATLDTVSQELKALPGDMLERRVASALGADLPAPERLLPRQAPNAPRGRVARAVQAFLPLAGGGLDARPSSCRRLPLGPGAELLLDERHPALRTPGGEAAILHEMERVLSRLAADGQRDG